MSKMRHWKQQYDADAPLEFAKRMRLGIEGHETVTAGEPVTDEIRAALGRNPDHRLKMWFKAGYVRIANWQEPMELRDKYNRNPNQKPALESCGGGGWYLVHMPGGKSKKVRGIEPAQKALDEAWDSVTV